MSATNKPVRRTLSLSAADMHSRVMAQVAAEQNANASGAVKILKVEVSMSPKTKDDKKRDVSKVSAQRVGAEVKTSAEPKAKGPLPVGLLLPATYTAAQYQLLIRDAGRRPMTFAGTGEIQRYPAKPGEELGAPKMMVDPKARIEDEIKAISGFCGYFLPFMAGSKEAGPHGAQLSKANERAKTLVASGRGDARMNATVIIDGEVRQIFPLANDAATTKAYSRSSAILAGYVKGMPDADRKLILDYLKREELAAFAFRMHEDAAAKLLSDLESEQDDKAAQKMEENILWHETQSTLERERLVEIRRVLSSKGVNIPATLLEKEIEQEGDDELRVPSANVETPPADEVIQTWDPETGEYAHSDETTEALYGSAERSESVLPGTEISPLAGDETPREAAEILAQEPPVDIAAQIEALKAEIAARKQGKDPETVKAAPKSNKVVEAQPAVIDVSSLNTDADLLAALGSL